MTQAVNARLKSIVVRVLGATNLVRMRTETADAMSGALAIAAVDDDGRRAYVGISGDQMKDLGATLRRYTPVKAGDVVYVLGCLGKYRVTDVIAPGLSISGFDQVFVKPVGDGGGIFMRVHRSQVVHV